MDHGDAEPRGTDGAAPEVWQRVLDGSLRNISVGWSNNTVRVMARNISPTATFDLGAATLSVQVNKRRVPKPEFA